MQQLKLLSQSLLCVNLYKAKENCLSEMLHTLGIEFTNDSKSTASITLARQNDFCGNKHQWRRLLDNTAFRKAHVNKHEDEAL